MKDTAQMLDLLGTRFLICEEMMPDNGEDSGINVFNCQAGVVGVFDGCGGLGALSYSSLKNKTGAYLASRAVCGAVKTWFTKCCMHNGNWDIDLLRQQIAENMTVCRKNSGETSSLFLGTMVRPFPTTVAFAVCYLKNNDLCAKYVWAGDSRTYLLDQHGLCQISIDDVEGEDAMSNLSNDGVLTNVVSADGNYELRSREITIDSPCILLAATDGCFGYLPSPMFFEYLILDTLMLAENVDQWKQMLQTRMGEYAEDDYTLSLAAIGFRSFGSVKKYYASRHLEIDRINVAFASANREEQLAFWGKYRTQYYRFCE